MPSATPMEMGATPSVEVCPRQRTRIPCKRTTTKISPAPSPSTPGPALQQPSMAEMSGHISIVPKRLTHTTAATGAMSRLSKLPFRCRTARRLGNGPAPPTKGVTFLSWLKTHRSARSQRILCKLRSGIVVTMSRQRSLRGVIR